MNSFNVFAGAMAAAWKSIAVLLMVACLSVGVALGNGPGGEPTLCTGDVVVQVYPMGEWQAAHPTCTVSALADACGDLPEVIISGSNCYPSEGTVDVAVIKVTNAAEACEISYLVQVAGGQVLVVVIDPE
jgi:hypothetical protein